MHHSSLLTHCFRCVQPDCVGLSNHRVFLLFLLAANVTILLLFVLTGIYYTRLEGVPDVKDEGGLPSLRQLFPKLAHHSYFFLWIGHYICYFGLLSSLLNQHMQLVRQNLTINEAINWYKYAAFQDVHGNFVNPYDRGGRENLKRFCCHSTEKGRPELPMDVSAGENGIHGSDGLEMTEIMVQRS